MVNLVETVSSNGKINDQYAGVVTLDRDIIKPSTTYTWFIYNDSSAEVTLYVQNWFNYKSFIIPANSLYKLASVTKDTAPTAIRPTCLSVQKLMTVEQNLRVMLIEGDYTNVDIPYFEGMQSVKMPVLTTTGKNLFDGKLISLAGVGVNVVNIKENEYSIQTEPTQIWDSQNTHKQIRLKQGEKIYVYGAVKNIKNVRLFKNDSSATVAQFNISSTLEEYTPFELSYIATEDCTIFIRFWLNGINSIGYIKDIMVEVSKEKTSYEPHKSNILTTNEEVELRGIGDAHDELDLLTGELTQRIGKIVLDGSEGWTLSTSKNNTQVFNLPATDSKLKKVKMKGLIMCDKLKTASGVDDEIINFTSSLYIALLKSKASTVEELKVYLSQNPITFIHELIKESVKTVDLSTVNQDGNDTKLSTFNDITYVALSSEGLIPEAELEVATKNEEDLEDSIVYTAYTLSEEFNTLYNTVEKPVKSAILKGKTLVNCINQKDFNPIYVTRVETDNGYVYTQDGYNNSTRIDLNYTLNPLLSNDKYYLISFRLKINKQRAVDIVTDGTGYEAYNGRFSENTDIFIKAKIKFASNGTRLRIYVRCVNDLDYTDDTFEIRELMLIEYQDGMENWDIPYFEGMKSVKMPVLTTVGKNLWCGDKDVFIANGIEHFNMSFKKGTYYFTGDVDTVYPNGPTTIAFSNTFTGYEVGVYINDSNSSATLKEDCNQVKIYTNGWSYANSTNKPQTIKNLMLSNTYPISYEPYKSNILTANEEVELRGIGEVQDELNLLTGELTQHIGEIVLDGSEGWNIHAYSNDDFLFIYTDIANKETKNVLCDKLPTWNGTAEALREQTQSYIWANVNKTVFVWLEKSKLSEATTTGFKDYLQSNPITLQYQLVTESIKTVDLSVVDQYGNDTKLSTFNDITHVTLSSEGLIPEAELEVAEKVTEVAASMLAISHEQEVIDTTTNEQSENVDSTMIATTEIYEGLL